MSPPRLVTVARKLAESVGDHLGRELRNVAAYDTTEIEPVYVRDDLEGEYRREEFLRLVAGMRDVHREVMRVDAVESKLGTARACVQYFESAFAIQLVVGDDAGVVFVVERETGRDLAEFVDCCRELIGAEAESLGLTH